MTEGRIVWRCLHGGALDETNIDLPVPDPLVDWPQIRSRNIPLLQKLIGTYGTCAMLARDGDAVVATLRFYPKALCTFSDGAAGFCLQQGFPAGPSDEMVRRDFPPAGSLDDRTLFVHCLMIAAPKDEPERYKRKGLATKMVLELIDWGVRNKWEAIEAHAYAELPYLYAVAGVAGRRFWEKLGFQVVQQDTEPAISGAILEECRRSAVEAGIPLQEVTNRYRMRLKIQDADGTPVSRSRF